MEPVTTQATTTQPTVVNTPLEDLLATNVDLFDQKQVLGYLITNLKGFKDFCGEIDELKKENDSLKSRVNDLERYPVVDLSNYPKLVKSLKIFPIDGKNCFKTYGVIDWCVKSIETFQDNEKELMNVAVNNAEELKKQVIIANKKAHDLQEKLNSMAPVASDSVLKKEITYLRSKIKRFITEVNNYDPDYVRVASRDVNSDQRVQEFSFGNNQNGNRHPQPTHTPTCAPEPSMRSQNQNNVRTSDILLSSSQRHTPDEDDYVPQGYVPVYAPIQNQNNRVQEVVTQTNDTRAFSPYDYVKNDASDNLQPVYMSYNPSQKHNNYVQKNSAQTNDTRVSSSYDYAENRNYCPPPVYKNTQRAPKSAQKQNNYPQSTHHRQVEANKPWDFVEDNTVPQEKQEIVITEYYLNNKDVLKIAAKYGYSNPVEKELEKIQYFLSQKNVKLVYA